MNTRAFKTAALLLTLIGAAACLDDVTGTRIPAITLNPDRVTAGVGDSISFSFTAQGTGIAQVGLTYGDGSEAVRNYGGPVDVTDFLMYAYSAAGTYEVVAQLVSAAGNASDTVSVTIN